MKLIDAGLLDEAEWTLNREAESSGESRDVRYLRALLLFKRKRFEECAKLLGDGVLSGWGDRDVYKLMARNAVALDRLDVAEAAFQSLLELDPADIFARIHLGVLYFTTSRFAAAEAEFQRVIELRPNHIKAYDFLGLAQEELRTDEEVIRSYRTAIQLAEQQGVADEGPYLHLAKFLWLKNRYEESEPFARKAVQVNAASAEAWYVLGRLLYRLGRTPEAEEALLTAVEKDAKYPEPRYLLSQLYRKLGRSAEADAQFRLFEEARKNASR